MEGRVKLISYVDLDVKDKLTIFFRMFRRNFIVSISANSKMATAVMDKN